MNYIMIRTDDMLNGDGLRVVLFLSACSHGCDGCHNPETWSCENGTLFDDKAKETIFKELDKPYISGLTLSGGDPLHENNTEEVLKLVKEVKTLYPNKTIWLYSGYTIEEVYADNDIKKEIVNICDVFVDGRFDKNLANVKYKWAGSTNQKVIDINKTLQVGQTVLKK